MTVSAQIPEEETAPTLLALSVPLVETVVKIKFTFRLRVWPSFPHSAETFVPFYEDPFPHIE